MGPIFPATSSRLPWLPALLVGTALVLGVGIGLAHFLLTSSPGRLFPRQFYFLKPVPGTSPPVPSPYDTPDYPGAAGADFAQIYFGARALLAGRSPYAHPSPDPFGRP